MEPLIKENNVITHLVETNPKKDTSLDFKIWEVTAWSIKDEPINSELFICGTIKWDGDSHLNFGDENGYLFLSGKSDFDSLKKVLDAIWDKARNEIKSFDHDISK